MAKQNKLSEQPIWQLPPDDWYRTQPDDQSVPDSIKKYYRVFTERRPPPEVLKRWLQLPMSKPERRVADARLGDPDELIAYLSPGCRLTQIEVDFLREVLEATKRGEVYRHKMHGIKWFLIASEIEHRVRNGEKQESVIAAVAIEHECSRSTVFEALKVYRAKYGSLSDDPSSDPSS